MSDCNLCLDQLLEPDPTPDFLVLNSNGSLAFFEAGASPIALGATQMVISFTAQKSNDAYTFNELAVQNTTDSSPLSIEATVVEKTAFGFTVLFAGVPDTSNFVLHWEVEVKQV